MKRTALIAVPLAPLLALGLAGPSLAGDTVPPVSSNVVDKAGDTEHSDHATKKQIQAADIIQASWTEDNDKIYASIYVVNIDAVKKERSGMVFDVKDANGDVTQKDVWINHYQGTEGGSLLKGCDGWKIKISPKTDSVSFIFPDSCMPGAEASAYVYTLVGKNGAIVKDDVHSDNALRLD